MAAALLGRLLSVGVVLLAGGVALLFAGILGLLGLAVVLDLTE